MPRIRPAKFVHIVYRTRRFAEMIRWYQTVFDARVQFQNPVLGFLTYDDEHHRFAFIDLAVVDPDGRENDKQGKIGVDHVAYTYNSVRDLAENYAWLRDLGIKPYWTLHHGVTLSMYYADPDGNQMEFQVDSFPTAEAATEYMHGPGYTANAIGVEFDPDELLARVRAGAPESEFLQRKTDLPISPIRGSMAG
jgi:catechol 2,3-dioxygenase-like lactoylglutathione lyase family enzyme